jgi:D-arabinose 1-dehydrogenase-like Zn-dependent alcohol dehydrogenase
LRKYLEGLGHTFIVTSDKDDASSVFEPELPYAEHRHLAAVLAGVPYSDRPGQKVEARTDRRTSSGRARYAGVRETPADIAKELSKATGQGELDAIIDCAGAPEMMQLGFSLLSISGHYADVGLVGDRIDIPLFPRVSREQTFHGSFWGNDTDLSEVIALAAQGKIRHTLKMFTFNRINEYINLLRTGEIVGRAVMKFDRPTARSC